MKKLLLIAMVSLLAACAAPLPPIPPGSNTTPANLTTRCPDLKHIDSPATLDTLMVYTTDLQKQYIFCAARADSLDEVNTPQPSTSPGK